MINLNKLYRKLIYKICNKLTMLDYQDLITYCIDDKLFIQYDVSLSHVQKLNTVYFYLEEYNLVIKDLIKIIKESSTLDNHFCTYDFKTVSLHKFLNKPKGVNTNQVITDYKNNLVNYYKEFKRISNSSDFSDQHKVRILSKFNLHLKYVNSIIIEFSILN